MTTTPSPTFSLTSTQTLSSPTTFTATVTKTIRKSRTKAWVDMSVVERVILCVCLGGFVLVVMGAVLWKYAYKPYKARKIRKMYLPSSDPTIVTFYGESDDAEKGVSGGAGKKKKKQKGKGKQGVHGGENGDKSKAGGIELGRGEAGQDDGPGVTIPLLNRDGDTERRT